MKFPVDRCRDCGLDLTTAEPVKVRDFDGRMAIGTCPRCGKEYFMSEVTPEPVAEKPKKSKGKGKTEPEPEPEPEPETPPEPEPEPEG